MRMGIQAGLLVFILAATGCSEEKQVHSTEQIATAIEKHIDEETKKGDGYFYLNHEGKKLKLKLVRVHMEYLSDLGGGVEFACVDLADISGDV